MTTYIFRRPYYCKADVDEFITIDRAAFEDFIMSRTDDHIVREVQRFGIGFRLAVEQPLTDLMEKICEGYYENMVDGDLFGEGMDALENAIAAMNLPKGGEVITTPFTF